MDLSTSLFINKFQHKLYLNASIKKIKINPFSFKFQFFFTRIVDDMSTAIRDHFRSIPDEFIVGTLAIERAVYDVMVSKGKQYSLGNKDQIEPFINATSKLINGLEKSVHFGRGKKEDNNLISKELQIFSNNQSKSSSLFQNWGGTAETMMRFSSDLVRIGMAWNDFGNDFQELVIEPLKLLLVSSIT